MTEEPKTIEVPGIPGRLREQTLDEYMSALPDPHLARTQLSEIRQMALEGMKAQHELLNLLKRIRELEDQLKGVTTVTSVTTSVTDPVTQGPVTAVNLLPPRVVPARAKCPLCDAVISTKPGPWASHFVSKHDGNKLPPPLA